MRGMRCSLPQLDARLLLCKSIKYLPGQAVQVRSEGDYGRTEGVELRRPTRPREQPAEASVRHSLCEQRPHFGRTEWGSDPVGYISLLYRVALHVRIRNRVL